MDYVQGKWLDAVITNGEMTAPMFKQGQNIYAKLFRASVGGKVFVRLFDGGKKVAIIEYEKAVECLEVIGQAKRQAALEKGFRAALIAN